MLLELVLILVCLVVGYNLQQRLLAPKRPPGPWGIPLLGHLPFLGTHPPITLLKWKKKYGNIISVSFGSYSAVVLNNGALIRKAFNLASLSGRPSTNYYDIGTLGRSGIIFADGSRQKELRRFVQKHLKEFGYGGQSMESKIHELVPEVLSLFEQHLDKPMTMKNIMGRNMINYLWSIMMSRKFEEGDPIFETFMKAFSDSVTYSATFTLAIFIPVLQRIFPNMGGFHRKLDDFFKVQDFVQSQIDEHETSDRVKGQPRDLTDALLDLKDESKDTTGVNIRVTISEMLGAGSETSSTTIEWMVYYLLKHPNIQEKLYREIHQEIGPNRLPTFKDRTTLSYCEAFVQEILRKTSVVPLSVFHTALEDTELEGYNIPKGTMIFSNLYAAHHDPDVWGDPQAFRPERFLDAEGKVKKMEDLMPFGHGKRACIGENLARNQLFIYIVSIVQRFKLEAMEELPSELGDNGLVWASSPFKFRVRNRG